MENPLRPQLWAGADMVGLNAGDRRRSIYSPEYAEQVAPGASGAASLLKASYFAITVGSESTHNGHLGLRTSGIELTIRLLRPARSATVTGAQNSGHAFHPWRRTWVTSGSAAPMEIVDWSWSNRLQALVAEPGLSLLGRRDDPMEI